MYKYIIFVCIISIFSSCISLSDNAEEVFGDAEPLKGQYLRALTSAQYQIPDSWPLALLDDHFIMGTVGDSTYAFVAIDTATKAYQKVISAQTIPAPSAGFLIKENDSTLFYRGFTLNRMVYRQGELWVKSVHWQPDSLNRAYIYPLPDGRYLQVGSTDNKHLVSLLDMHGKEQYAGIAMPAFMEDYNLKSDPLTYIQGMLLKHPDENSFVYVSKTVNPYCVFFRIDDQNRFIKIKEYMLGDFTPVIENREVFYSFQGGASEAKYVYLSFFNLGKDELLVFDWNGKPIQRYALDFRLSVLAERADKGVLYAKGKQDQVSGIFRLTP